VALAVYPASTLAGSLVGKTTFSDKNGPAEGRVKLKLDTDCTAANSGNAVGSEDVIVNKSDGTLRNVIVYVKNAPKRESAKDDETSQESIVLDQKGCTYHPHVLTLMTGRKLTVKNSDRMLHNIHGLPQINPGFNLSQHFGATEDITFVKPEIFKVKCDVHPWMSAWIGVFNHPYHAVSDKDGAYRIDDLPAGDYEVVAVHEVYGEVTQKVTVKDGEPAELSFEIARPKK